MLPKYSIEYAVHFKRHAQTNHYSTDDPVACEQFLVELLERGFRIQAVRHEGVELPRRDFDKMIKSAAGILASKHVCAALGIDSDEAHVRFGTPA
jgi:hypothetical protein